MNVLAQVTPPVSAPTMENWTVLLPEIVVFGGALLILLLDAAFPRRRGILWPAMAVLTLAAGAAASIWQWSMPATAALGDMVVRDRFGILIRCLVLGTAGLTVLTAHAYMKARELDRAEFYALLLLAAGGMTMLAASADLIMVFLSVEVLSLALYVMTGIERGRSAGREAAMKYFLLGAFASAFLLYGVAFVFGASGTTNLLRLGSLVDAAAVSDFRLAGVAVAFLAVGLGFKASMVPFHMWTPDAYEGAPTPVTVFMAGATKAAAFAALVRALVGAMPELRWDWQPPVAALVLATMVFASLLAIAQTDVKRMLAYSSVAHAGFIGLGVLSVSDDGTAATLMYLLVYAAMTVGAFASVMLFREGATERTRLASYSGLGIRRPLAAALFAFFLFALAGIPPTGGFWAKWYVFFAAMRAGYAWLAVVAVLASVVAAFFYVRVAVVMFMQDPPDGDDMPLFRSTGLRVALAVCFLIVLASGILPEPFLDVAREAVLIGP